MVAHQSEIPTPVRELSPETPPALAAVVERLMEKAPDDRYESMAEVVHALQRISSSGAAPVPIRDEAVAEEETTEGSAEDERDDEAAPQGWRGSPTTIWKVSVGLAAGVAAGLLTWWLMHT